jgi:2-polyprenyl-3-methyl-5-hydroxy-6-metoxy-1,4-benzoquinol methylase
MPRLLDPEGAHAAAVRSLADLRDKRVLEVGCGNGRLTEALAGDAASWLATDPNASAVGEASRRLSNELAGRVTFAIAGGAEIEADESEFDLVLFSWSL